MWTVSCGVPLTVAEPNVTTHPCVGSEKPRFLKKAQPTWFWGALLSLELYWVFAFFFISTSSWEACWLI